jgi:hypothetical protein
VINASNREREPALPSPFHRLDELVRACDLHRGTEFHDPLTWLLDWMNTPRPELDGRCPSSFTDQPDGELVLTGLLLYLAAAPRALRPRQPT